MAESSEGKGGTGKPPPAGKPPGTPGVPAKAPEREWTLSTLTPYKPEPPAKPAAKLDASSKPAVKVDPPTVPERTFTSTPAPVKPPAPAKPPLASPDGGWTLSTNKPYEPVGGAKPSLPAATPAPPSSLPAATPAPRPPAPGATGGAPLARPSTTAIPKPAITPASASSPGIPATGPRPAASPTPLVNAPAGSGTLPPPRERTGTGIKPVAPSKTTPAPLVKSAEKLAVAAAALFSPPPPATPSPPAEETTLSPFQAAVTGTKLPPITDTEQPMPAAAGIARHSAERPAEQPVAQEEEPKPLFQAAFADATANALAAVPAATPMPAPAAAAFPSPPRPLAPSMGPPKMEALDAGWREPTPLPPPPSAPVRAADPRDSDRALLDSMRSRLPLLVVIGGVSAVAIVVALVLVFHSSEPKASAKAATLTPAAAPPVAGAAVAVTAPAIAAPKLAAVAPTPAAPKATVAPAAGGPCTLDVTTTPAQAEVRWNGQLLGLSPLRKEVACGAATLTVTHPRYQTVDQAETASAGTPLVVHQVLVRPAGKLEVSSAPPGAEVAVNGRSVGRAPVTAEVQAYETATVTVSLPGYREWTKKLYVGSPHVSLDARLARH